MADNVAITAGSGTSVATDQVGSDHFQKVKLADGTADSSTMIAVDVGAKANALRIAPANDITDATYIGDIKFGESLPAGTAAIGKLAANDGVDIGDVTVNNSGGLEVVQDTAADLNVTEANSGSIKTAVELIDNAISGNEMQVDVVAALPAGTNAIGKLAANDGVDIGDVTVNNSGGLEVIQDTAADFNCTEANSGAIKTAVELIDNAISGSEMQVDVVAALPAGTNAIGKLAANDGVDIGNVDVASIAAGTNIIGKVRLVDSGGGEITETTDHSMNVTIVADDVGIGGGTQYTEDAAAAADPVGNAQICVRKDAPAAIVSADGDNIARRATNYGAAYCQIVDSSGNFVDSFGGSGGTASADDADFTAGTTQGTPAMGVYESSPTSITDGDMGVVGVTQTRSLKVQETNSAAILADTANMDTNIGTIAGAIAGNEVQADIITVPAPLNVSGGGAEATALRVTIANDSTGVLSVDDNGSSLSIDDGGSSITVDQAYHDNFQCNANIQIGDSDVGAGNPVPISDNGGAITVDGTVTANLSATDNTVLDNIDSDTTAIQTAVEIIDDWDSTHDSAASADGPQLMAAYDSTKPTAVGDGDAVRILADGYGRLLSGLEPEWFNAVYDSADATGEGETVKAATASKKIYLLSAILSSDVEGWMKLQDEDSNALTGKFWLKAGGGVAVTWPPEAPLVLNVANKALEVIVEAAGNVSVTVTGYLAP